MNSQRLRSKSERKQARYYREEIEQMIRTSLSKLAVAALLMVPGGILAQSAGEPGKDSGKPNPLKNVYFGEQHLHTADSPDAFAMGTTNSQDDAFNFCKGKPIKKSTGGGYTVQKKTPYDWCAVTDHAVMMGLLPMTFDASSPLYKTKVGELIRSGKSEDLDAAFGIIMSSVQKGAPPAGFDSPALQKSAWEAKKKNANAHNDPGKFTTLIAFEWTSIPYGQNLHRNVFSGMMSALRCLSRRWTQTGPRTCGPTSKLSVIWVTRPLRSPTIPISVTA
jgi:hypothetical protein